MPLTIDVSRCDQTGRHSPPGSPLTPLPDSPLTPLSECMDVDDPRQHHPTLYMPTGDIVLSAEKYGDVTLFRVHKATLSYHSPEFRDMFALPPSKANEMYDGVPVVEMQDDHDDLVAFLEVLYGHQTARWKRYHPDAALATMGALKLIAKYQVEYLREQLVRHIEADWPKSPMEWIAMYRVQQTYKDVNQFHGELAQNAPLESHVPEPVSAILLARECGIPSILPAAFLELSRIERTKNWDRIHDADEASPKFDVRSARWRLLDWRDRRRVREASDRIYARCVTLEEAVLEVPADICRGDFLDCQAELAFRLRESGISDDDKDRGPGSFLLGGTAILEEWPAPPPEPAHPLVTLQRLDDRVRDWDLCKNCYKRVRQNIAGKMQECWAELPDMFDLHDAGNAS